MKLDNTFVYTAHRGLKTGDKTQVSPLLDEFWKNPKKRLAATDFDNTLTRDDIGTLVFEESCRQPDFWKFSIEEFQNLLSPNKPTPGNKLSYRELVNRSASGNIKTPKGVQEKAQRLNELFSSLEKIYKILQEDPHNVLIRERFASEMGEFDEIVLELEPFFADFFGNQIFSRTRFLAGKSPKKTKDLAQDVLNKGRVQLNEPLFEIFRELKKREAERRIVTTNLFGVVREMVARSALKIIFSENDVIATKLVKNHLPKGVTGERRAELSRYIEGDPIFGKRKVELLKQESVISDKKFSFAAGDSAVNDGPMLAESLKNDGVSLVVISAKDFAKYKGDIEAIAENFQYKIKNLLKKASLSDQEKERLWFIEPRNQFRDARYLQ